MFANYEEQIKLQHSYTSRPESPILEGGAAKAIEEAFRDLIEHRYLYQKVTVDLEIIDAPVAEAIKEAQIQASTAPIGRGQASRHPAPPTPEYLRELREEIGKRPWRLTTRHMGDNPQFAQIHGIARAGSQPLGTPQDQMDIYFYLPAVQLWCSDRCKRSTTVIALVSSKTRPSTARIPAR